MPTPIARRSRASREAVGDRLVVQITSELLGRYSPDEQKAVVLKAKPEAVSLALREFAPEQTDEAGFGEFLGRLKHMRIWPQIILYSADEAARLGAMRERGLIPFGSLAVLYVLGRFALLRSAAPSDILPYLAPGMPRFEFVERLRLRPAGGRLRDRRRAAWRPCPRWLREQPLPTRRGARRLQRRIGRDGLARPRNGWARNPKRRRLEGGDRRGDGMMHAPGGRRLSRPNHRYDVFAIAG